MTERVFHPELISRVRSSRFVVPTLVASAALLAGTLGVIAMRSTPPPPVPDVCATVEPVPAPTVIAPPVDVPAPALDAVEPEPLVRSPVPLVEAECLVPDMPARCRRDDGFPAISGDGKTIAVKYYGEDSASDDYELSIMFIDVKTSRVQRFETLVPRGEYPRINTEENDALLATVERRAVTVQQMLDDRAFRAMAPLGRLDAYRLGGPPYDDTVDTDTTRIHAEFEQAIVNVVDPETHSVLGRLDFTSAEPRDRDPDGLCIGWMLRSVDVAWDPSTRIVLGTTEYEDGGCLCSSHEIHIVKRLPARLPGGR